MAAESTLSDRDGWENIHKGFLSVDTIRGWIKEYFNVNEDMVNFKRRNEGYLELRSFDKSRGYTFVGAFQLNRDYEGGIRNAKAEINEMDYIKKRVVREFVDHDDQLAGFSWRVNNE